MSLPIDLAFKKAHKENRPALLTYIVAGDNNKKKSLEIMKIPFYLFLMKILTLK